jgi:hypothetical protein
MSLASLNNFLLSRSRFLGLRPANAPDGSDEVEPARAGTHHGLTIEGAPGGEPVPVVVDTSALATHAKQDQQTTVLGNILAAFAALATHAKQDEQTTVLANIFAAFAGLATHAKQDQQITALNLIKPGSSGPVVDLSGGDVDFAPGVQLFVAVAGTLKYDDDSGNVAQPLPDIPAGATTPWLVTKVYAVGTTAVLVAVSE